MSPHIYCAFKKEHDHFAWVEALE